jgi:hypothetical protein
MSHVCEPCGGKGWIWTGAERVLCHGCLGSVRPRPSEDWSREPMPGVPDPSRARLRPDPIDRAIQGVVAREWALATVDEILDAIWEARARALAAYFPLVYA